MSWHEWGKRSWPHLKVATCVHDLISKLQPACLQDEDHVEAFAPGDGYVADAPYHFTYLPWCLEMAVLTCMPWEVSLGLGGALDWARRGCNGDDIDGRSVPFDCGQLVSAVCAFVRLSRRSPWMLCRHSASLCGASHTARHSRSCPSCTLHCSQVREEELVAGSCVSCGVWWL